MQAAKHLLGHRETSRITDRNYVFGTAAMGNEAMKKLEGRVMKLLPSKKPSASAPESLVQHESRIKG